jgi:hypothetical protein
MLHRLRHRNETQLAWGVLFPGRALRRRRRQRSGPGSLPSFDVTQEGGVQVIRGKPSADPYKWVASAGASVPNVYYDAVHNKEGQVIDYVANPADQAARSAAELFNAGKGGGGSRRGQVGVTPYEVARIAQQNQQLQLDAMQYEQGVRRDKSKDKREWGNTIAKDMETLRQTSDLPPGISSVGLETIDTDARRLGLPVSVLHNLMRTATQNSVNLQTGKPDGMAEILNNPKDPRLPDAQEGALDVYNRLVREYMQQGAPVPTVQTFAKGGEVVKPYAPRPMTVPAPAAPGSEAAYQAANPAFKPPVKQQPDPTKPTVGVAASPVQPPASPVAEAEPTAGTIDTGMALSDYGPSAGLFNFSNKPVGTKKEGQLSMADAVDRALSEIPPPDYGPPPPGPRRSPLAQRLETQAPTPRQTPYGLTDLGFPLYAYAKGGIVAGGPPGVDTVDAKLSNKEYVLPQPTAQAMGGKRVLDQAVLATTGVPPVGYAQGGGVVGAYNTLKNRGNVIDAAVSGATASPVPPPIAPVAAPAEPPAPAYAPKPESNFQMFMRAIQGKPKEYAQGGQVNPSFRSTLDGLAKLDAQHALPSGGKQYTMEVALGPMASAKGQALMRVQKTDPVSTMKLAQLQRRMG